MNEYDCDLILVDGVMLNVIYHYDIDSDPPWERCDGSAPVRWTPSRHREGSGKRPGERPMNSPGWRENQYYYDWAEACRLARQECWNTEPFDAPNRIERAVQADFDFLSAWVNEFWCYVGVTVAIRDDQEGTDGEDYTDSLWGVETWKDYHKAVAQEMATELVKRYKQDLEDARIAEQQTAVDEELERIERQYWEQRDVMTVGYWS